jgi:5-formyltetrahydrofolate cyclo-ligase
VSDLREEKQAAREVAYAARKVAHAAYRGTGAVDNLLDLLACHRGKAISAYMPIRTEIDCLGAMARLSLSGPVAVPVIVGKNQPLEFHRWTPLGAMQVGPFGAQVPVAVEIVVPEVVILPLLAFDRRGYRLGYGGGFYDRTLEELRRRGPVLAVGFAYAAQEIGQVPTEATDQVMDIVVTECGVTTF